MGQKTHPIGFRLGITKGWLSNWYAGRRMAPYILLDELFRQHIEKEYPKAQISRILINRTSLQATHIIIYAARPGILIGKDGGNIKRLQQDLLRIVRRFNKEYQNLLLGKRAELGKAPEEVPLNAIDISLREVLRPELDARLVAKNIAEQLEARISHRRAMKSAMAQAMRAGAEGIKIRCTGRLGGSDMSRSEEYKEGHIALQTLRSDIDYATATAHTIYGAIGVKVWILKGTLYGKVDLFPWMSEEVKSGKFSRKERKNK
ncbi:MAG: 30S ribosomal protein S3 [Bacteroidia bacterium]|jgi:small subunit ribosomal protein S3|nr:30S ribosomal protein S3 [Bacteroidia bacterium]GIV22982.1 MAG: 30S ribosomal protein S3 [Bacteroidia bacterium]